MRGARCCGWGWGKCVMARSLCHRDELASRLPKQVSRFGCGTDGAMLLPRKPATSRQLAGLPLSADGHGFFQRQLPYPPEGFRQRFYEVGSNQRMLSCGFASHISSEAVQIDNSEYRLKNLLWILCEQACDHAGQNVSGAARRHAGISGSVYPHLTAWLGDQSSMAFEDDDQFVLASEFAGGINAIALHLRDGATEQACHLAGMWCNH